MMKPRPPATSLLLELLEAPDRATAPGTTRSTSAAGTDPAARTPAVAPVAPRVPFGAPLVGTCCDPCHPYLFGRIKVRWDVGGQTYERWLPTLANLAVRMGDRVLMSHPANWDEAIVTGVIDGFVPRDSPVRRAAAQVDMARDESVRVLGSRGQAILEIRESDQGPVVRLLDQNLNIETTGELRLAGASVKVEATAGEVNIQATGDVVVEGEIIHLN